MGRLSRAWSPCSHSRGGGYFESLTSVGMLQPRAAGNSLPPKGTSAGSPYFSDLQRAEGKTVTRSRLLESGELWLCDGGFTHEHIGFASHGEEAKNEATDHTAGALKGAAGGSLTGGVVGGLLGALATVLIPGIGPVIAGGLLAGIVAGAVTGGAIGGRLRRPDRYGRFESRRRVLRRGVPQRSHFGHR
jgi:hypothetical protein